MMPKAYTSVLRLARATWPRRPSAPGGPLTSISGAEYVGVPAAWDVVCIDDKPLSDAVSARNAAKPKSLMRRSGGSLSDSNTLPVFKSPCTTPTA